MLICCIEIFIVFKIIILLIRILFGEKIGLCKVYFFFIGFVLISEKRFLYLYVIFILVFLVVLKRIELVLGIEFLM